MARLPYLEPDQVAPEYRDMLKRNTNLHKLLVNSPDMARAFSGIGGYIRFKSKLDPRLRELAILQVGWMEKSEYEFTHHVKIGKEFGVGDAEFLADLHMMSEFIFRLLHPADLQDRELAQPRVELALEADVAADAAEGARHVGRVDQQLVQIGVALEHVAIFGCDLIGLEIGQAGHVAGSPLLGQKSSGSFQGHSPICQWPLAPDDAAR